MEAVKNFRSFGRKIVAVGRNYGAHAAELNNPIPDKPLLFFKPTSAYVTQGTPIKIPLGCKALHHEVELGVVISKTATSISAESAMNFVGGYALALDMTARDFQDVAKAKGHPWFLAKGFDTACPVSDMVPLEKIRDPSSVDLWLKVNGETKQSGCTKDMIFTVPILLQYISKFVTLEAGDLILTGTPSGVGKVDSGDQIECGIRAEGSDIVTMKFSVE